MQERVANVRAMLQTGRLAPRIGHRLARALPLAALAVLAGVAAAPPATAGVANAGLSGPRHSDPLAGMRWGNYTGDQDEVFLAYRAATGYDRTLLGRIALRPRVRWFGAWYATSQIEQTVRDYIANATG